MNIPLAHSFVLVPQAKLAMIGFSLVLLSMIITVVVNNSWSSVELVKIVTYAAVAILGIYITNCTVVGNCNTYAWINGYVVLAVGILAVFNLFGSSSSKSSGSTGSTRVKSARR